MPNSIFIFRFKVPFATPRHSLVQLCSINYCLVSGVGTIHVASCRCSSVKFQRGDRYYASYLCLMMQHRCEILQDFINIRLQLSNNCFVILKSCCYCTTRTTAHDHEVDLHCIYYDYIHVQLIHAHDSAES